MFGYFDLVVLIFLLANYIYNRPKVKKFLRKKRKINHKTIELLNNGRLKRFNCMKCGILVAFILKVPTGVYSAMGIGYLKQQANHKLCKECLFDFKSFEASAFKNTNPAGGALVFKLIMLDLFLADKWSSFSEVVGLYNNYDHNFKNALPLFSTKEFDGDIYALRDAVILSMDKKE
jgi:hypothetical protein